MHIEAHAIFQYSNHTGFRFSCLYKFKKNEMHLFMSMSINCINKNVYQAT